jgi:uncharacterized membrane protein YciS (DUF1049 family)
VEQQSFKTHAKVVPAFTYFVLPMLAINVGWASYRWERAEFSIDGLFAVLTAVALLLGIFYARVFALRVQDRVVRLEERLRYERVLPADLLARVGELSIGQIVALRFASDGELPGLMRKVLDERLVDRKAIKGLVVNWRADHLRA